MTENPQRGAPFLSFTGSLDDGAVAEHPPRVPEPAVLLAVSLEPTPVIEAYKQDVDRTLLRANLALSPTERVEKMIAALRFVEAVRRSRVGAG